jgi:hypothetical protein
MKRVALLCLIVLALIGCTASVRKNNPGGDAVAVQPQQSKRIVTRLTGTPEALASSDWERLDREWRKAVATVGARLDIEYVMQDDVDRTTLPGVLAVVTVTHFHYVAPGARYVFGVMTGSASLVTQVQFSDLQTGASLGERNYSSASKFSQGIFAAVSDKQVDAICTEIVLAVKQ